MPFVKAVKENLKLRIALDGITGAGKTYTALRMATAIANAEGKRIAFIDTERSSAKLYADKFDFDHMDLKDYSPETYVKALREAKASEYSVVIIDSLSHAWMGPGGALDTVDRIGAQNKNDKFGAWRTVTPMHNKLVDEITRHPCHVIVTMRTKMDYIKDVDANGRSSIRKAGMAVIQREGIEYEFDLVATLEPDRFYIEKSRFSEFDKYLATRAGEDEGAQLLQLASSGQGDMNRAVATKHTREELLEYANSIGLNAADVKEVLAQNNLKFSESEWEDLLAALQAAVSSEVQPA